MIAQEQLGSLRGKDVFDRDGDKIGSLGQVYLDTSTNQPAWASVNTGFFGLKESLVPLADAEATADGIRVPYDKATVKDAPNIDVSADEPLMDDEVARLYQHYSLGGGGYTTTNYDAGGESRTGYETGAAHASASYDRDTTATTDRGAVGYDTSGPTTDDAMTRSEERLNVGTQREQVGRARLRKYVVTENVQTTVPVSREEVRLEREPITDANIDRAMAGPDISEEEHEVVLHAERAEVGTEAVPVERVRLGKETVTEQQTVSGEVRKERIEFEDDTVDGRRRDQR